MSPDKPLIVGIGNKARQGKMRVAKAIHCAIPDQSWIMSLADSLKAYCRVNGWMGVKDSALLQHVGTDIFRKNVDPDHWVKILGFAIEEFAPDYGAKVILVPDIRFPNEAEWVKRSGGLLLRVDRLLVQHGESASSAGLVRYISPDRDPSHESEVALDGFTGWDAVIQEVSGNLLGLAQKSIATFHGLTGIRSHLNGDGPGAMDDVLQKARAVAQDWQIENIIALRESLGRLDVDKKEEVKL